MRSPQPVPRFATSQRAAAIANAAAERDADDSANRVLAHTSPVAAALPQRACRCGDGCPRCRPAAPVAAAAPPALASALGSGGRPLDAAESDFMEPRFGADFSSVRIHVGALARAAADALGASPSPSSRCPDRRLLAHELAHVLQQRRGGARLQLKGNGGKPKAAPAVDPAFWEWWKLVAGFEGSLDAWKAQPANAADRGGETNWGVTKKTYLVKAKALGLEPTEEGFAALTPEQAMRSGHMMWKASGARRIANTGVAIVLADWCWGGITLKRLTALLKAKGFDASYELGSPSKATTDFMNTQPLDELVQLMSDAKAEQYEAFAKEDPKQQPFLAGWLGRNEARRAQAQPFAAAPAAATDADRLDLWGRAQRALRQAASAETAAERDAARAALQGVVAAIDRREAAGFAHAEESLALRMLRDELRQAKAGLDG